MLNRSHSNAFVNSVLLGLVITVAVVLGALTHAAANVQAFI
jgi:hypothetical protein